jgi:hypothetical protein
MKHAVRLFLASLAVVMASSVVPKAHFILLEPASWIVENERGDPQKAGPCGGTLIENGTPSNAVTKVQGNQKLHLKLRETIYHPGHYRVALAVNSRAELPEDPPVMTHPTERGAWSDSAKIDAKPQAPVLADGLFVHATRPSVCPPTGACSRPDFFETDVQLPNISCPKCTLQVVEFMAEHGFNNPGGYYYHHCADLQITADASKPIDKGWPALDR